MAPTSKRRKGRPTPTQSRAARRIRRNRRRRFLRAGAFTAIAVVSFLFIAALFAGSLPISIGRTGYDGVGERFPELPNLPHVTAGETHPPYNSRPATSGRHYAETAPWGLHDQVLPDELLLHNLEHGGVGIHYDCPEGCDELVTQLSQFAVRSDGDWLDRYIDELTAADQAARLRRAVDLDRNYKVVMSPYPEMDTTIALTAWTYMDAFDVFDADRIKDFILANVSSPNAPEPDAR